MPINAQAAVSRRPQGGCEEYTAQREIFRLASALYRGGKGTTGERPLVVWPTKDRFPARAPAWVAWAGPPAVGRETVRR